MQGQSAAQLLGLLQHFETIGEDVEPAAVTCAQLVDLTRLHMGYYQIWWAEQFDDDAAQSALLVALAPHLPVLSKLQQLHIGLTLDVQGAVLLSTALMQLPTLQVSSLALPDLRMRTGSARRQALQCKIFGI